MVCVSANADLSAGRAGARSCGRATRAAAPDPSCLPRRRAAAPAPAGTAAAAAHAGSQGVPWGLGLARFPSGLRDQEHQRDTPENKRKQERLRDLHAVVIKIHIVQHNTAAWDWNSQKEGR